MQIAKDAAKRIRLSCFSKLSRSYVIAYYDMCDDVTARLTCSARTFFLLSFRLFPLHTGYFSRHFSSPSQISTSYLIACVLLTCMFVQHLVESIYILHYDRHRCRRITLRSTLDRNMERSLSPSRGDRLLPSETRTNSYNQL